MNFGANIDSLEMHILFKSTSHQRFENDIPVRGLQVCNRAIKVEPNVSGCNGYKIIPGIGYIVSIINLDGNHPLWGDNYQMNPKPMKTIRETDSLVTLRGYEVLAQTPFGWQVIDLSNYGVSLFQEKGEVIKVRLDMFDRNTYIEYYK